MPNDAITQQNIAQAKQLLEDALNATGQTKLSKLALAQAKVQIAIQRFVS